MMHLGQQKGKVETKMKSKSDATIPVSLPKSSFSIDKSAGPVMANISGKPGKRVRLFSWQRRNKRMRMNFPNENVMNDSYNTTDSKENLSEELKSSNATLDRCIGKSISPIIADTIAQTSTTRGKKLCDTGCSSSRNVEAVVNDILLHEHPGGAYLEQVTFPTSRRSIDSDLTGVNLKVGELKEVANNGIFTMEQPSLSFGGNSEHKFEISSNKKSCANTQIDLLQKVLSLELEKQENTLADSKKVSIIT